MTYNEETKTLTASVGKVLRRKEDGTLYGDIVTLGYSWYVNGKRLDEPHLDVPDDFEEVDDPNAGTAPVTLEEAKELLRGRIVAYDSSGAVNSFLLNGVPGWMTADERTRYTASVSSAETLGESSVSLMLNGSPLTLPLATARTMLAKISRYADNCWMVTQRHLMEVDGLASVEDALGYDYRDGYPERLEFEA